MTIDAPRFSVSFCAMLRAVISSPPPAAKGTISRMGRDG